MAGELDRVIDDIARYREAIDLLVEGLHRQSARSDEDIAAMRSGITMTEKMRRSDSSDKSRDLTKRLEHFEAARRDIRVSITAALLAEGRTTAEIAALFGVSRQLAERFIHAARDLDPGPGTVHGPDRAGGPGTR